MSNRRMVALSLSGVLALAACTSGGGATTAPTSAPTTAASESAATSPSASAAACTVGVSWNNFQQPRWAAHDEPDIRDTVVAGGGTYISADANLSAEQQLTDVDYADLPGRQRPGPARPGHHGRRAGAPAGQGRRRPGHRL